MFVGSKPYCTWQVSKVRVDVKVERQVNYRRLWVMVEGARTGRS